MAVKLSNYQCPSCTGPLRFNGKTGKLECEYCGSSYTTEEIEALLAQQNAAATEAYAQENGQENTDGEFGEAEAFTDSTVNPEGEWDSNTSAWGAEGHNMKAYNCNSCGAELVLDANTMATGCPYCGSPTMIPGVFSGDKKPELVIPFKIKKEQAMHMLTDFYAGKKLLPGVFRSENHIKEIKGVYVPFWLFDGEADAKAHYNAEIVHTRRTDKEIITETDVFDLYRAGTVAFEKIPVDASSKMPDNHMDSLEPYDYSELVPFKAGYMAGYMADQYDMKLEDCSDRADSRACESALRTLADTCRGYTTVTPAASRVNIRRGTAHYALLPVWLLSTQWEGKNYLFAVNGQTGKMVSDDLPSDKSVSRKTALITFGAAAAVITVLLTVIRML